MEVRFWDFVCGGASGDSHLAFKEETFQDCGHRGGVRRFGGNGRQGMGGFTGAGGVM